MMATAANLLATGFVVDKPGEGTTFPSAGGNSADPEVQAIYWRCLVTLFASARITNPNLDLALFTNVTPPSLKGVDLAEVLARYRVEVREVPLTRRLDHRTTPTWGNVLYFFDILDSLMGANDDRRFALVDSDVLLTADIAPLFAALDGADYVGYVVDTPADEDINGLSREEIGEIIGGLGGPPGPATHFGGELFATRPSVWKRDRAQFGKTLDLARSSDKLMGQIRTEEHVFSVVFPLLERPVADAGEARIMKRIWTSPRCNTAAPGDERLPIWHLPAEKRYGLADMYGALAAHHFPTSMEPDAFRALAMRLCGVPSKNPRKVVVDGVKQVAAKLGLRR